jgi:tyrosyl-tRNA synthetase
MDVETKLELIKGIGEEIITEEELKQLLETKEHPVAYDGFEPSGLAHLPFGVFRPLLLKDLLEAGVRFKLYLADYFAWINNKLGGRFGKNKKMRRILHRSLESCRR